MDFKNDSFLKTVAICASTLALGFVFPTAAVVAVGAVSAYLYTKGPRDKSSFFKAAGATAAMALTGSGLIGLAATVALPFIVHSMVKDSMRKSFTVKSNFERDIVEKAKKVFHMKR